MTDQQTTSPIQKTPGNLFSSMIPGIFAATSVNFYIKVMPVELMVLILGASVLLYYLFYETVPQAWRPRVVEVMAVVFFVVLMILASSTIIGKQSFMVYSKFDMALYNEQLADLYNRIDDISAKSTNPKLVIGCVDEKNVTLHVTDRHDITDQAIFANIGYVSGVSHSKREMNVLHSEEWINFIQGGLLKLPINNLGSANRDDIYVFLSNKDLSMIKKYANISHFNVQFIKKLTQDARRPSCP